MASRCDRETRAEDGSLGPGSCGRLRVEVGGLEGPWLLGWGRARRRCASGSVRLRWTPVRRRGCPLSRRARSVNSSASVRSWNARSRCSGCAVARCTIESARARTRLARRDTSQKGAHHRRRPSCRAGPGPGQTTLHRVSRRTPRFGTGRSPPWPISKKPPRPGCTGTTPTDSCTASADAHQPKPRPTTTLRPTRPLTQN